MSIAGLVQVVAAIAWIGALAALFFVVFNRARGRSLGGSAALVGGIAVLALVLSSAAAGLVFIEPEERGVVVSALQPQGYRPQALGPGLHWVIPFAERVTPYRISNATYTMSGTSGSDESSSSVRARTKDGQEVFIDASVIYAIDPSKVIQLHIAWQNRFQNDVVVPLSRGIIRDAASQFGVEEIVSSQRAAMEESISTALATRLADNDLILVDFVMRDIHFSEEYAAAVEQKQIAEQQAQQAAFVVEQRRQEAEQARVTAQGQADAAIIAAEGRAQATVLQAQAESESLTLIAQALSANPDVLTFRYIDKLSPNVQVIYLPSGQDVLLPLPTPTVPVVEDVLPPPTEPVTDTVTEETEETP
jgi:regulator of protease activity HflC (stomatin/prohibitin superfamily)